MNTRLNKKVKKDLDAYFKGFRGSDPEVHHGLKHILIGALTDANFHSEAKKVQNMFPKANKSKYAGRTDMEDSIEQNHGVPIAKAAKWDGYEIIDAISFFASMFIGGPVGAKITSLKEGMNENVKMFVSKFIKEVTHSHEYEDMSSMGEDENDKEEIKIGEYQTKYFHVCPGASSLYGDIESKGVDMDMAERSVRLQDALFFIEEHVGGEGYSPDKDYVMVAKNIAKNIMKMGKMMGLEKEHSYIQGHVDTIIKSVEGKKLEERIIELTEKNVPTDSGKWAASKAAAKKKFDVYPSAYANAWAAKNYKAKGGGWKTENKESIDEAKSMDTKKKLKVYDKLKKGDEITIKYGSSMSSGREGKFKVTKGKTVVGKQKVERIILQNVANPKGVKYYLYQRNGNVTMAIGDMAASIEDMHESVNEGLSVTDERHYGKKGIIIMIDDNGKKVSAIFKNKKNADKYNRNKSSDLQTLLKLAKNTPYPKAIDESVNESLNHNDMYTMLDIAAGYSSTQHEAAGQMWSDEQDLYDYLKSDHIPKKYHKKFYNDIKRRFKDVNESVNEAKAKSKDSIGMRFAEAIYNNVEAIIKAVEREKMDVDRVVNSFGPVLVNAIKTTLKHKFKPTAGNEDKLKSFYSELKQLLKVAESLVKRPSKAGIKKLDASHREWWNHNGGADVVLNGKYTDNIIESLNEAKEPEVITTLRKIVKDKQNDLIKDTKSGKKVRVDMGSANLMVQVYDALKKQSNKDKFVKSGIVNMGHMAYKLMKKENTSEVIEEAEYQGRKVELNKPMQGDSKKFKVYVKNEKGNVVVVHFGAKGMNIKKNNPKARKSFRARMNCDNPGPKWKANYWSCRKW